MRRPFREPVMVSKDLHVDIMVLPTGVVSGAPTGVAR